MTAKKNYHKPAEDPRTIGGGLKAAGRERREKLQMIINSRPQHTRNDLLPEMKLQTLASSPCSALITREAHRLDAVGDFLDVSGVELAHRVLGHLEARKHFTLGLTATASSPPTRAPRQSPKTHAQPDSRLANTHLCRGPDRESYAAS
jgi:ERCC4-related helicase